MPELLVEVMPFNARIVEDNEGGVMKIEGVFQRADTKNANNRVYPRKLWERILSNDSPVSERLSSRSMIGHLEHPADGVTDLRKGAIIVTGLNLDEKGQVIGKAEILDTPDGEIIKEYVRKNVLIGISSRGKGTVQPNGQVAEDYALETFDIVNKPSTPGANPKPVAENLEEEELDTLDKEDAGYCHRDC